jgi:two-component system response regulator RpfG
MIGPKKPGRSLKGSPSKYLSMGAIVALGHHERYDGSGYRNSL